MTLRGLSIERLAESMGKAPEVALGLLYELADLGMVELGGDELWRLTELADGRFGACLRDLLDERGTR